MPFPHPESGKHNDGNEDKPNQWRVVRNLFKRTVDITGYRYRTDNVNPAEYRTFGGVTDHFIELTMLSMHDTAARFSRCLGQTQAMDWTGIGSV
jgi:hypothetical protein